MTNNEISTILDGLYARIDATKYALICALVSLTYFLHFSLELSFIYVISAIATCLVVTVVHFYQLFTLKKAIAIQDDLEALVKQERSFTIWDNMKLYISILIIPAFLVWLYGVASVKPDNKGYAIAMLLGAVIGGIIGYFKQKTINKEIRQLSLAIAQQVK